MPLMKRVSRQVTRARIIAAALELFARDGFEQTTVRRIASACDLTDAALYYYFESKQEILDAVLEECWDERRLWPAAVPEPCDPLTPEVVDTIVDWTLDGIVRNATVMRLVARCCLAGDPRAVEIRTARQERWRRAVTCRLGDHLPPEDAETLVESLRTLMITVGLEVQIACPADTAAALNDPTFRARVRELARRAAPIERLRAAHPESA